MPSDLTYMRNPKEKRKKEKYPHRKIGFVVIGNRGLEEVGLDADGQKGPMSTDKTWCVLRMSCAIR